METKLSSNDFSPNNIPRSQDASLERTSQSVTSKEPFTHKPQQQQFPPYDNESQVLSEVLQAAIARDVPKVKRLAASLGISKSGSSSLAAVVSSTGDLLPDSTTTSKESATESTPVEFPAVDDDELALKPSRSSSTTVATTARTSSASASPEVTQSNIIAKINQVDLDDNQGLPECSHPATPAEVGGGFAPEDAQSDLAAKPGEGLVTFDISEKPVLASQLSECQSASISSTCQDKSAITKTTTAEQQQQTRASSQACAVPSDGVVPKPTGAPFPASTNQPELFSGQPYTETDVVVTLGNSSPSNTPATAQSSLPEVLSLSLTPVSPQGDFLPVRVSLPGGLPDVVMQVLPQPGARMGESYTIDVPSHLILSGISSALASGTAAVNNNKGTPVMLYISPASGTASSTTTTTTATPPPPVASNQLGPSLPAVSSQLRPASVITSSSINGSSNNNKKMRAIAPKPSSQQSTCLSVSTSSARASSGLGKSSHKRQSAATAPATTSTSVSVSVCLTATATNSALATVNCHTAATPFLINNSGAGAGRQQHGTSLSPVRSSRGRRRTAVTISSNSNSSVISSGGVHLSTFPCGLPPNVLLSTTSQHAGAISAVGALSDVNAAAGAMLQPPHLLAPVTCHGPAMVTNNMQRTTTIMSSQPGIFAPHDMNSGSVFQPAPAMPFLFSGSGGGVGGTPLIGAPSRPSPAAAYMFQQPPFHLPAPGVGGSISTPPVYAPPPSSCGLLSPLPTTTSVAMMQAGGLSSSTVVESSLFPSAAAPLCPSSGRGILSAPYANQPGSCLPMNSHHQYAQPTTADSSSAPFGISLVCSQTAGQGAVGMLLPHDTNDASCLSQSNSLVYSLPPGQQPMLAPGQQQPVLTAVSSSTQFFSTSSASSFSAPISSELMASLYPPALYSSVNGMLSLPPAALIPTPNSMVFSTGPGGLVSQQSLLALQTTDSCLSTFNDAPVPGGGEAIDGNQIGDNMDQDDLLTLAWRLTQEDFDNTGYHNHHQQQPLVLFEANSLPASVESGLGIYANAVSSSSHGVVSAAALPAEFVDCDQLYAEQQQQQQPQHEAESDEVVLLDYSTTPPPSTSSAVVVVVDCQPPSEVTNQQTTATSESTGNADIDALLAAAAQIGAASGVGDAQSSVAVAVPVSSCCSAFSARAKNPPPAVNSSNLSVTSVLTTFSASETETSPLKPVDSVGFEMTSEGQAKYPTSTLEQAADDLFAEFPPPGSDDVNFAVASHSRHVLDPADRGAAEVPFDGTDEPTSLAAVLGCNAEDAADLESVLGPEVNEVGESGAASHSFLNSLVGDEAAGGVVDRHIFDEDFTVCGGDGNVLDKCFETRSADIDCRSRESDVPLHDENSYSSTSCSTHDAVSTMTFPTPSSKQVRSLLRNTLPAPMSFHFDELSGNGRRLAVGRAEAGTVSDPTEDVDAVFLGVDFSDDVGEYTTAEQFQEALMLLGPQPNSPNFDLGEGSAKSSEVNNIFTSVSAITVDLATAFNGDENLPASIDDNDDDTPDAAGDFVDIRSPGNQDDDNNDVPVDSDGRQNTAAPASPLLMETSASCLSDQMKVVNPDTNASGDSLTSPVNSVSGNYSPNKSMDTILTGIVSPPHYDEETVESAAEVMNFTRSDLNINTLIGSLPGAASPPPLLLWSLASNSKTSNPPRSSSLPNLHLSSLVSGGKPRQRCSSAPPSSSTGVPLRFSTSSPLCVDVDQVAKSDLSPVPDTDDSLLFPHNLSSEMVQPDETSLPAAATATSSIISVLASSSALVEAAVMYSADNAALDSDVSPVKSNLESLDKLDRMLESCQRRSQQNDNGQLLLLTDSSKPSSSTDSDSKNVTTASREEESLLTWPSCLATSSAVESGESQRSPDNDKAVTFSLGDPADSHVAVVRPTRAAGKSRRSLVTTRRRSHQHVSPVVARLSSDSTEPTDDSIEPGLSSDAPLPTTSSSAASASPSDVDSSLVNGVVDKALATFGIGSKRPLSFGLSMDPVDCSKPPSLVLIGNFTQHLPQLTLSVNGSLFLGAVDPSLCDDVDGEAVSHPPVASSPEGDDEAVASTRPLEQLTPRCRSSKRRTKRRVAKGIRQARRAGEESVVVPASQPSQPFARFADSNCTLPSFASIQTGTVTAGICPLSSQVTPSSASSWLPASGREALLFGSVVAESPSDWVNNNGPTSVITSESSATLPTSVALQSSPGDVTSDGSVSVVDTTRKSSPPLKLAAETGADRFEPAVAVVDTPSSTSSTGSFTSLMNTSLRQPLSFGKEDTTSPFGKHPLLTNPILSTSTTVAGVTFGSFAGAAAFRATSFSALAAKAAALTTSGFQELKSLTFSDLAKKTNTSTRKSWTSPPLSSSSVSSQQHQQGVTSTPPFPVLTFSPLSGVTPRQCSEPSGSSSLQPTPLFQNAGIKPVGTSIGTIGCPKKSSPPSSLPQCSPEHNVDEVQPLSSSLQPPTNQSGESAAPKLLICLRGCNSVSKSRRWGRRKFPRVSRLKLTVKKVVATTSAEPEVSQSPAPPADDAMAEDHCNCSKLGTPLHQLSPASSKQMTAAEMGVHYSPSLTPTDDALGPVNTSVVVAVLNSCRSVSEHLPNGTLLTPSPGSNKTAAAEPIDDAVDESSFQDCAANNFVLDVCSHDDDAAPTDDIGQDKRSPGLSHSATSKNINGVCTISPSVVELPHDTGEYCVAREAPEPREPLRLRLNLKLAGIQHNDGHKSKTPRLRTRPAEDGSGSVCPKKRRKKHRRKAVEQSADTQLYPSPVSESVDPEPYPTALPQQQPSVDVSVPSFEHSSLGQKHAVIPLQGHNRGRPRNPRTYKLASRARGVAAAVGPTASTYLLHATGPATGATTDLMVPSLAGGGRSSSSSGAFSRKIFSTAKQERRSSCALLVARPWRPVSVISPRKRGMISNCSTPVSAKANKLTMMRMPSSASSVARKHSRSKKPVSPVCQTNRRVHKKEIGLSSTKELDSCQVAANLQARSQTPIRLVIRLGQQQPPSMTTAPTGELGMMTAVKRRQSTAEASGSPVSVTSGTADSPSEDEAELFQFCIATEAETYVDVNQAQIHRTANPAVLAHLSGVAGGYQMQPLLNDSKTAVANSREAGSVNTTVFAPPCPGELGTGDPSRRRQKTSRRANHRRCRGSASRRTEDDVVVDVVSVGGNELTSLATEAEHLRHQAAAYDDERRRAAPPASDHLLMMQRHNGYLRYPSADRSRSDRLLWSLDGGGAKGGLGSVSTLDNRGTPAVADGCSSGPSGRPVSASATQQQRLEKDNDDPYHHLTPHSLTNSRQELPHQQNCRPADANKNDVSLASYFMPDRLTTATVSPAVVSSVANNNNQITGFPGSSLSQPQAMEPVFPPEPSCAWPPVVTGRRPCDYHHLQQQQEGESLSSFSSQPPNSHQQQQQALAMVYANAALRARNCLELHQQQQDRMKAQWTSSLYNGSSGSAWPHPDASVAPPASHLPSLWDDFSYKQQRQPAAGDQQQSKLTSASNFFLDYRQSTAASEATTDFHSHHHRFGGTLAAVVAQSPFSAVDLYPQAHPSTSEAAAVARLTAEFAPPALRVQQRQQKQQSEPRVSGW